MLSTYKRAALIYGGISPSDARYEDRKGRIAKILSGLRHCGIRTEIYFRGRLPHLQDDFDLVIAAGGDGTVLETASVIRNTPLLPVRLFPETSVGFLCSIDYQELIARMKDGRGAFEIEEIARLQCLIDDYPIGPPILNEALIAHACPARASRYEISFGNIRQIHCSSGIWVATRPGSHGAAHAAGADMLEDTLGDGAVFCVRECSRPQRDPLKSGTFDPDCDHFLVRVLSSELYVFTDGGIARHTVVQGQSVTFRTHTRPLKRLKWVR